MEYSMETSKVQKLLLQYFKSKLIAKRTQDKIKEVEYSGIGLLGFLFLFFSPTCIPSLPIFNYARA
jgi:hypothetical protein